ncbi:iron-siderophore ABC transporter substrate-binding protein [Salinisphaera sp. S4-8]|uniref:iron-siderophore ABC transporter substrate-binding protein n=1 Tax=Salinisphaera sp. S4-8 TaxID=633357 RepID=UPI0033426C4A
MLSRRAIRIGWLLGLALFFCAMPGGAQAKDTPRVAVIDWGQAQTLIALGAPPVAMSQIPAYNEWVAAPDVPDGVRDLGLRVQPNMELLSQLDIDVVTITSMYSGLRERLAPIAPVEMIDVYDGNGAVWDKTVESTRRLGALVGREAAAEALIDDTQARIAACAAQVPNDIKPLLVVQFMDARHVRVYTEDSLVGSVLKRMDIANAWQAGGNYWGFATVPLERLASIENARMVVVKPLPVGVAEEIESSVLWHHLPAVNNAPVLYVPPVWGFGGLPSASRFARVLVAALGHDCSTGKAAS